MPSACAPTVGRVTSNVASRPACASPLVPSRARASRSSSFSLPPSRQAPGMRQSSRKTSAVCDARRPCFLTFVPISRPLRVRRDDERGLAAGAQLGVDGRDDHVDVGDAAVGGPCLLAVEDPLVRWPRRSGRGCAARRRRSRRRARRRRTRRPSAPRACRSTAAPTRRAARACPSEDAGDGERRAHDRHADAGVAPEQLLVDDRERQPGRVGPELREAPRSRRGRSWRPPG